jgi:hypothetical protein
MLERWSKYQVGTVLSTTRLEIERERREYELLVPSVFGSSKKETGSDADDILLVRDTIVVEIIG